MRFLHYLHFSCGFSVYTMVGGTLFNYYGWYTFKLQSVLFSIFFFWKHPILNSKKDKTQHDVHSEFVRCEPVVVIRKYTIIHVCLRFSCVLQKLFITLHETQRNWNMSNISNIDNTSNISNTPKGDINRLKVVLVEQKKTAKWLAEKVGRDPATVSKWCTNIVQPNLETLRQVAAILDVDIRDLLCPTR